MRSQSNEITIDVTNLKNDLERELLSKLMARGRAQYSIRKRINALQLQIDGTPQISLLNLGEPFSTLIHSYNQWLSHITAEIDNPKFNYQKKFDEMMQSIGEIETMLQNMRSSGTDINQVKLTLLKHTKKFSTGSKMKPTDYIYLNTETTYHVTAKNKQKYTVRFVNHDLFCRKSSDGSHFVYAVTEKPLLTTTKLNAFDTFKN